MPDHGNSFEPPAEELFFTTPPLDYGKPGLTALEGGGEQPWARSRSEHVRTLVNVAALVVGVMGLLINIIVLTRVI